MMTGMSNRYLTMMMWVLFLPIFESRPLLKKEPKPTGALKLQINQRGLTYAKNVVMEMLLSQLKEQPIPDQRGSYNVPSLGEVSMWFSNTRIIQLQADDSVAYFDKGTGVRLAVQNAQVVFNSNWKIKHFFGQDNGIVQTNVSSISLSVLLGLDVDSAGRPLLQSISCLAEVDDFELTFSGPNSYLYNLIAQTFKKALISDLNQEVCTEVRKSLHYFSQTWKYRNFWAQIDPVAGIDYSLVSKPEIDEDRCNLDFKGEFFLMGQRQRSPLVPTPIILPHESRSMVAIGVSDVLVNSAAFVYFAGNTLRAKYTDEMIPKRSPFRLNTQSIGYFVPELRRQFPEMPIELHLEAQQEPKLHFHHGGLDAIVLGRVETFVVLPNSSLVPVFTLNIECNFTGHIFLEGVGSGESFAKVGGSVALQGLRLSQEWSRIGEIQLSPLETVLKIAGHVALARHNKKLRAGKLLPSFYGASLVDPEVSMHEGYMLIKTDLRFSLPNSVP
ncbi:bactericidal permeability-increasing protein-like [Ahaetulla prasina]|uniref:bactericidal permeability-increasing protein-like n=1 Tax=Ahaetulla prasina TaxID=499056 RepID=UPI0026489BFD|nr:bactericidal permeability-increasing protein-like [Ahaetulla prasina]